MGCIVDVVIVIIACNAAGFLILLYAFALVRRQNDLRTRLETQLQRANHDLELAKEKAVERLREAKEEAAGIVESANKRGTQLVEEAKQAALAEAQRVKVSAQAEIEQELNRAREQLRSQVAVLSLAGAEKILAATIDPKAHEAMVEELAAEP